ncbi:MAG: pyridoxamine 5'-phosphate oxidase family protein [Amphiplicatus sp.]
MTRAYYDIAFTEAVLAAQRRMGSAESYAKFLRPDAPPQDALGEAESAFIAECDGFYQATTSETGWPYVQFRGGTPGFIRALDAKTLAYADFRGNRQYLSVGNLSANDRVALFFMDYANRRRLKIFGRARMIEAADDPALVARLFTPGYRARPERAVVIAVAGFDWNCPQHIPQRFTIEELQSALAPLREEMEALRAENAALKEALDVARNGA